MLSVIVCTYNRAEKLSNLLDSLARMHVPAGIRWELIVVDNNSTDGTARLLDALAATTTLPLRRVFESRQGLAAAHNAALAIAQGEIIAFTDDDCRVAPDWLEVIAREFGRDEALCLIGGRVELFNPEDWPITLRTGRERLDLTGDSRALDLMIGCNMAFRRDIAERVGYFDTRFGAGSDIAPSGDDMEFVYRMMRTGGRIVYSPDLLVLHDHGRRTHEQVRSLQRNYLRGRGAMYAKHVLKRDRTMARLAYWETCNLLADAIRDVDRKACLFALRHLFAGAFRFMRRGRRGDAPDASQRT